MRLKEEEAVRKHMKVFAGGLPGAARNEEMSQHFGRYGHVLHCSVLHPKESESKKSPYAFVTFRYAADADCAVVDTHHLPGAPRPLMMGFAAPRKKDKQDSHSQEGLLSSNEPCKVFVGGINDRDNEEEIGDFFSQWGLVALVYRDTSWGLVHFATREGAMRLLEETNVVFRHRKLDIKASDSKKTMGEEERNDLIRRAIAGHFHKKAQRGSPPDPSAAPGAFPGYYPPPAGYYAAAGYPPHQPGAAAYPPRHPGHPGYPGAPGYPAAAPQAAAGYPPPQAPQAAAAGYYGGAPAPGAPPTAPAGAAGLLALPAPGATPGSAPANYYGGAPPPGAATGGAPHTAPGYYGAPPLAQGPPPPVAADPMKPPSTNYYPQQAGLPGQGGDPYATAGGHYPPHSTVPRYDDAYPREKTAGAPSDRPYYGQESVAPNHRPADGETAYSGYYRDGDEAQRRAAVGDEYFRSTASAFGAADAAAREQYYRSAVSLKPAAGAYTREDGGHGHPAVSAASPYGALPLDPYGRAPADPNHQHRGYDNRYQPY